MKHTRHHGSAAKARHAADKLDPRLVALVKLLARATAERDDERLHGGKADESDQGDGE